MKQIPQESRTKNEEARIRDSRKAPNANVVRSRTRPTFDETYMDVVEIVAERSTCLRKKVGAVIVVDKRIISHGYNGVVKGEEHCCDTGVCLKEKRGDEDYKICMHAEQNAICQCAKRGLAIKDATLYVNADICFTCAKLLISCEISRVVVKRDFQGSSDVFALLEEYNVKVEEFQHKA